MIIHYYGCYLDDAAKLIIFLLLPKEEREKFLKFLKFI